MIQEMRRGFCFVMGLLSVVLGLQAQADLSIVNFQIGRGETKTVTIDMANTVDIRAVQVRLTFPENLKLAARPTIVSTRLGTAVDEFGNTIDGNKSLNYKIREDGSCMIVVNANDAVPFSGSEGAIISLTLKAAEDAAIGKTTIGLCDMELVYADGYTYIRPNDKNCEVEVCEQPISVEQLVEDLNGYVDVYGIDGKLCFRRVPVEKLVQTLEKGKYLINGVKVVVAK